MVPKLPERERITGSTLGWPTRRQPDIGYGNRLSSLNFGASVLPPARPDRHPQPQHRWNRTAVLSATAETWRCAAMR